MAGVALLDREWGTVETPLVELPYEALCPGAGALDQLMGEMR